MLLLVEHHRHQFEAALDAQLLVQPVLVILHRVVGDEEGVGDVAVAIALEDELNDLSFPF